jgi:hypothetical protein
MAEEKEKGIIGYFTEDRNIYCVDCILKTQEMMKKKIEKAITADDTEEGELFCDECNKEIK